MPPDKGTDNVLSVFLNISGGDTNARAPLCNRPPLDFAIDFKQMETAQTLLFAGADLNYSRMGNLSLFQLAPFPPDFIRRLVENGADVNPRDSLKCRSTLELALANGDYRRGLDLITLLLDRGAAVNPPLEGCDATFQTAVNEFVAEDGNMKTIRLLLEKGADVNAAPHCEGGKTALQYAAIYGERESSLELIQLLLDEGADVNAVPAQDGGITALQRAAIIKYLKIAHMFLERGADPNAPGAEIEGRTVLEGAAEHGRLDMALLLLNVGAEPSESAAEYAESREHFVIADLIRKAIRDMEESVKEWGL